MTQMTLRASLEHLLNCYSQENGSNTPDFILSKYLLACLQAFNEATNNRAKFYDCACGDIGSTVNKSDS